MFPGEAHHKAVAERAPLLHSLYHLTIVIAAEYLHIRLKASLEDRNGKAPTPIKEYNRTIPANIGGPMNFFQGSRNAHVEQLNAYQVEGGFHLHPGQVRAEDKSVYDLLQPIDDATHTRDRKRSPPDSACARGTRLDVVQRVGAWTSGKISSADDPHIRWMYGYVGCGKSAISQEVCDTSERQGRPVASFFFFRGAGDRSKIWRLAPTLANPMAASVPATAPLIRAAMTANPALKNFPAPRTSVAVQMQHLIYRPLKAAVQHCPMKLLLGYPFLIVIDGLDECEDKDEVQELLDGMLLFFEENPLIPLRIFITSRVEQHIQSRLNDPGVQLDNLVDHCSNHDISTFLDVLFEDSKKRDPIIQAYIRQHGEWPSYREKQKLVRHIGGSFIFASAVFKFVIEPNTAGHHTMTPMERLPLALEMNPGLDELYAQTLARSEHLPRFLDIISTIALLVAPLPTSGIAELLGIHTYEVINVLVNLQAIIQIPGTDEIPVTFCHTSLRDFLSTQSRSGRFFARPRHHVHLFLRCLECELGLRRRRPGVPININECSPVIVYARRYPIFHLDRGKRLFEQSETDSAIQLCRQALALSPGTPELIHALANVVYNRACSTGSLGDVEEAISLYREALQSGLSRHPDCSQSVNNLANAILERYRRRGTMCDLEEAISLYREALELGSSRPDRSLSLNNLANALLDRYQHTGTMGDLEEAISLHREALERLPSPHPDRSQSLNKRGNALLERYRRTAIVADLDASILLHCEAVRLRPPPHPDRAFSLNNLATALLERYRRSGTMTDLEEAISLCHEALDLQPSPHPDRPRSLSNLVIYLHALYERSHSLPDLQEAISHCEELLTSHYHAGDANRLWCLDRLISLLEMSSNAKGRQDFSRIEMLREERDLLSTSATSAT